MWNTISLPQPPNNSFNTKSSTIDVKAVLLLLENGQKFLHLKAQNALRMESGILSRCVYRMKLQFRNDKGFKYMEKTNTLLKKLLEFNLFKDLRFISYSIPRKYGKSLYLPTRQMLEYVLVRMQGYVQLAKRVAESAVNTAQLMNYRLTLGHLWTTAAVVLALVSRIWQICKYLIKKCCILYNDLLPLRDKLELVGCKWLEDDYEFPTNLIDWLDVDWLHESLEIVSHIELNIPIFNLLDESDDEDVQYCYQYNLNDCIIINDDSTMDDDVPMTENLNSLTEHEEKNVEHINDDSDVSSVEIVVPKKQTYKQRLSVDKEEQVRDYIEIDDTNEINSDHGSRIMVEDDDIGETVSRNNSSFHIPRHTTIRKVKKKRIKKKGKSHEQHHMKKSIISKSPEPINSVKNQAKGFKKKMRSKKKKVLKNETIQTRKRRKQTPKQKKINENVRTIKPNIKKEIKIKKE